MSLVVLEHVTLHFGGKRIVDDLNLRMADGDRIGLIGPNGSGKTTLLRLIAGEQTPDGGEVRTARGARIGWLPQDIDVEGGRTLLDLCTGSVPGRAEIEAELAKAEEAYTEILERGDEETVMDAAARLADLHERIAHFETTFSEHEAKRILAGLGFTDADHGRDLGEFSGGWKMRGVLASLLFQRPDVLLLDEPTNHLDMPSVAWFSSFLQTYRRPFVLISHDREFLNEQINRVVSLEVEGVRAFPGNYEKYVVQRAEEEIILENKAANLEREREKALQWINRFRAKASKAKAVQSRIKAYEKMESVDTYRKRRVMSFAFPKTDRPGHEVVRVSGVSKAYGEHVVLPSVNLTIYRGDRIGIIGPNGAGKTTLLKLIAGELEPTGGEIELGHKVTPSYYAQHHAELLHDSNTVYDEAAAVNREIGQTRVRTVLGSFLFSGDDVDKKVGVLSGGERARVTLAKLLLDPGNLLLLDEPTNHLDLESCESLVETLDTYDGTMLFVSHNRALVRKLATKIWAVENGVVTEYPGNLDDYMLLWRARYAGDEEPPPPSAVEVTGSAGPSAPAAAEPKKKRNREEDKKRRREDAERRRTRGRSVGKLEKIAEELLARIDELEAAQKKRNDQLCDPAAFANDAERFAVLTALQVDATKIEELTMRWEAAQEELEQAQAELRADADPE
ncbi:MAG: ABC-F family ATP-binding cassette domain-containing protein [Sandaracinaceae bacterium]|nr:ABC-F family ATP-binding cassette domain-containing protein [Sandaracinaceae bacterium]